MKTKNEENPIKEYKTVLETIKNFINNKQDSMISNNEVTKNKLGDNIVCIENGSEIKYTKSNYQQLEKNMQKLCKVANDFGMSSADVMILTGNERRKQLDLKEIK